LQAFRGAEKGLFPDLQNPQKFPFFQELEAIDFALGASPLSWHKEHHSAVIFSR
jgi:hypothetical protein